MKILDPGHEYILAELDKEDHEWPLHTLRFVKREGDNFPGNVGHYHGTTTQEVIRVLIDRIKYVDNQKPHGTNRRALLLLRDILIVLEERAASQHGLLLGYFNCEVEDIPVCPHCGHWACEQFANPQVSVTPE